LTLAVITVHLGGLDQWWPDQWPAHWPEPVWGYDPDARVTFFGAMLATLVWYICTTGSDQMAIQRYLATRNVREARKMLIFSLAASVLASILLSVVGLALLGYFQAQPELIPGGELLAVDTDRLFPRFIQIGLPPGLTGLVMAGLLAASMSSLSSGVSASCSVITVDFLDRFRRRQSDDAQHIKTAKIVSVFVGIVVILLSSCVTLVEGNLLELAYKICNLLTAPLFGLFFMAMFVRRATGFGTMVGAAGGLATVVAVNFWKDFTGTDGISFIWAMPLGLFVQISLGTAASLLPVGQRR